jgi:excisionase family DNA binding protein
MQTQFPGQPLLTVPEIAKLLHVTCACVRRMVRERRIDSIKVGRSVRFDASYIADYLKANTRHAATRQEGQSH